MCVTSELQMWMSVLKALITVMMMQLATTMKGVTPALATLDTQAMAVLAHVSVAHYLPKYLINTGGCHQYYRSTAIL